MNEFDKIRLKRMKKICSAQGWTLILYNLLMTVAIIVVFYAVIMAFALLASITSRGYDEDAMLSTALNSGFGYLIAIAVGILILLIWKKPKFFSHTLFKNNAPMEIGSFLMIFALFIGIQGIFQILTILFELFLNNLGFSILNGIEIATGNSESISMFIYASVAAPISEELLFRGVLLRSLEPMGKKFAIFTSALLFGLFHGNIVQIPFAFLIGLILAYVALEHSIWWAMLMHLFNNLILSDTISRVLPESIASIVMVAIIYGCLLAGGIILLVKRNAISQYIHSHRNDPLAYRAFWSSGGMIAFMVFILLNIVYTTYMLITPYTFVS